MLGSSRRCAHFEVHCSGAKRGHCVQCSKYECQVPADNEQNRRPSDRPPPDKLNLTVKRDDILIDEQTWERTNRSMIDP